jgi:leucyl aminopeptidase
VNILVAGAMKVAIGHLLTGAFTNSKDLWKEIQKAGVTTGDRMWRFPLYKEYQSLMSGKIELFFQEY